MLLTGTLWLRPHSQSKVVSSSFSGFIVPAFL
jgi:hypothetical protein